jgi:hypothetical protein
MAVSSSTNTIYTFTFVQPPEGTTYVMRGVVELETLAVGVHAHPAAVDDGERGAGEHAGEHDGRYDETEDRDDGAAVPPSEALPGEAGDDGRRDAGRGGRRAGRGRRRCDHAGRRGRGSRLRSRACGTARSGLVAGVVVAHRARRTDRGDRVLEDQLIGAVAASLP